MSEERDDEAGGAPAGRRSSYVPPAEVNNDYVPSLPPVGSSPIPAAADVNYFPSVQTGAPQLNQPTPPARLVLPNRQSLTEEQIATRFAESSEMTSTEQIALLDAQMTLREADIKTATEFYAQLLLANPAEAAPLLDDLKSKFGDLDESIGNMTVRSANGSESAVTAPNVPSDTVEALPMLADEVDVVIDGAVAPTRVPVSEVEISTPAPVTSSANFTAAQVVDPDTAMLGRYRGWSTLMTIAVTVAALIPAGFAVFTAFGAPIPDLVSNFLGSAGVVVLAFAVVISLPLVLMARSTAFRHGLGWRAAFSRVFGGGGLVLAILAAVSIVVSLVVVLLVPAQGIGQQLAAIDVVAQTLSTIAPNAHIGVVLVALVLTVSGVIAALPRRLFRAKALTLTGFVIAGPSVFILQGLAIAGNTTAGPFFSMDVVTVATAIVPIVLTLVASTESGIATATSRDETKRHGLWLYIGLALGAGFAAWTLVEGFASSDAVDIYVGSNPVLHATSSHMPVAIVLAAVIVVTPLILIVSLALRHLAMATTSVDRNAPALWVRIVIVVVPLALLTVDVLGLIPDPMTFLPQISFVSVPLLVVIGALAGASIASKRVVSGGARVTLTIASLIFTTLGLAATTWALPFTTIYESAIAPILASVGISGTSVLAVPAGLLVASFVVSLIASSVGSRRSIDRD